MKSNILIQDNFDEFNLNNLEKNSFQEKIPPQFDYKNYLSILKTKQSNSIIEHINDENYILYENEVKYKIFEDFNSISKNNNMIELQLNIPHNIISINKIKIPNQINKFVEETFICNGNEIIKLDEKYFNSNTTNKIIYNQHKNIKLYIYINTQAINKMINKSIFINYSYAIFKNKVKFI